MSQKYRQRCGSSCPDYFPEIVTGTSTGTLPLKKLSLPVLMVFRRYFHSHSLTSMTGDKDAGVAELTKAIPIR